MNPTYCKNSIIMLDSVTGTQMNSFIITTEDGKSLSWTAALHRMPTTSSAG